jgi:hypothetical protein
MKKTGTTVGHSRTQISLKHGRRGKFFIGLYSLIFTYIHLYWLVLAWAELAKAEGLAKDAKDGRDDNDAPATGRAVTPANVD